MPWRITAPNGESLTGDDVTLDVEEAQSVNELGEVLETIIVPMVTVAHDGYDQVITPDGGLTLEWVQP